MRSFLAQVLRFGAIGAVGFIIDVGLFNLLSLTVLSPSHLHEGPLWAKVISTSVAIVVNWLGNRYWTFRTEVRRHPLREGIEFAIVAIGGLLIGLGALWVSHYVLGYTSQLADNVSANGVGLVLGTLFRFSLYRLWVFNPKRVPEASVDRAGAPSGRTLEHAGRVENLGSAETPV